MRKIRLVASLLFGLVLFNSCSNDDDTADVVAEVQLEDVMVQNSPWTFSHYELINVVNAGTSAMTPAEIESDMNLQLAGFTLIFNQDGTGETAIEGEESESWTWVIENEDNLRIVYAGNFSDEYFNLSLLNSQLKMEAESVTHDSAANLEVLHYGSLVFE
ncbi:hypothetical protein J2X31_002903 [Flavobacterium arsenatis]|uniref:Lipocalin-like domain-containing protein n=1 Tax=Flavobacterium arsenatis TaxID=1484332 RepID=A0ABU1TSR1_9FLAO|nr:hypothetical protein [Flavobacterium arsenatis]MDR6968877.1 hypothetical protein [Flavobacterium arsenatis]